MSFANLTLRERMHIERAYSQALYYAQRGLFDAMRIYTPSIPPEQRAQLTGVVGEFLTQYVIAELAIVVSGKADAISPATRPMVWRNTADSVVDVSEPMPGA